ncbi:13988_t:CDS:2 [Gigaspora margarita]|uniref:13988_t:CDS:1 n=1 Tax=Gigaspora margarita TaxID=4874 RepID=A0ABN7UTD3_GIGMA|nr:13988_t:CDS:2 [Gigaspora margarita]
MANPNQPTFLSNLVNQLAQLLQQLQVVLASNQTEFYQKSWKEPCYTPNIQKVKSKAISKKQCPKCYRKNHYILKYLNVTRLDKRNIVLFIIFNSEQYDKFLEIIIKRFLEVVNNKQIPKALEFSLKILENMIENKREVEEMIYLPS